VANVLFLSLVFPPDAVSTAQIMGELAADLRRHGHTITVVTTAPHYNRDAQAAARQPLRARFGGLVKMSDFQGVPVYHAWMPRKTPRVFPRLLAWLQFHLVSTLVGLWVSPRPDVLIVPSPPLTIGLSAWVIGRLRRAPYIYNVQEIYPDIAVNLGVLRNRRAIRALEGLERFVYDRAAAVTVIASRMRQRLIDKGVEPRKVHVIPNFVDLGDLRPGEKQNAFSTAWHLADAFVVTYAGNLGPAQGLETFVDAAALLRDEPDLQCLLVGSGTSGSALQQRVDAHRLSGCRLIPHQPYSAVPDIYGASDVCLVAQAAHTGCDAIPSKVYRIMACGRPVIACTDPASDLAQLITDAGAGVVVAPGSALALAEAMRDAARNRAAWAAMGRAGRAYVEQHYGRERVSLRYHELVARLAPPPVATSPARALP
jgi:colanic acid biosynthesis glycosyl transferase WcaI